jgi:hypothetical protein
VSFVSVYAGGPAKTESRGGLTSASWGRYLIVHRPYLKRHPGLLLMLFAKMSGSLTWGLAELIEVQLSALPAFQLSGLVAVVASHRTRRARS